jgi:hypothetical protein
MAFRGPSSSSGKQRGLCEVGQEISRILFMLMWSLTYTLVCLYGRPMATVGRKVPVSERALIQRINRKLAQEDKCLKAPRGLAAKSSLGDFYILNWARNFIVDTKVDLERLGRKLGVLADWEDLERAQ